MNNANQPVNPPTTPVQNPVPEHPVKNQRGNLPIILGVLVLLFVVGAGAYYLGMKQNKPLTSNITSTPSPTENASSQVTPLPTTSNAIKEYKARYFNLTDNLWENTKYPTELTQLAESSLTPISCTPTYSGYGKDYTSYDEKTQKSTPLTDASLLNYIQTINNKYEGKTVSEIFACSPEQGKTVVLYSLGPCGGGCSGIPYVGVVNGSDIQEAGTMQEGMAYFGCRQPLQLTKDNMFYFRCGGGDGPGASTSIYKLSLNNLSLSKVKHCEAGIDEAGKSYSKCE